MYLVGIMVTDNNGVHKMGINILRVNYFYQDNELLCDQVIFWYWKNYSDITLFWDRIRSISLTEADMTRLLQDL